MYFSLCLFHRCVVYFQFHFMFLFLLFFIFYFFFVFFFFSSRRRHTRCLSDWSSDVCSSDLCDCGQFRFFCCWRCWLVRQAESSRGSRSVLTAARCAASLSILKILIGFFSDRKSVV